MRIASLALAAMLAAMPVLAQAQTVDTGPISPARLSADVKVLADSKLAGRARAARARSRRWPTSSPSSKPPA
jgi:hypothetical protein